MIKRIREQKLKLRRFNMSASKWAYVPEKCDGDYCCGCCDNCPKADLIFEEDIKDGKKSN